MKQKGTETLQYVMNDTQDAQGDSLNSIASLHYKIPMKLFKSRNRGEKVQFNSS